jgi:hypothetical protein
MISECYHRVRPVRNARSDPLITNNHPVVQVHARPGAATPRPIPSGSRRSSSRSLAGCPALPSSRKAGLRSGLICTSSNQRRHGSNPRLLSTTCRDSLLRELTVLSRKGQPSHYRVRRCPCCGTRVGSRSSGVGGRAGGSGARRIGPNLARTRRRAWMAATPGSGPPRSSRPTG